MPSTTKVFGRKRSRTSPKPLSDLTAETLPNRAPTVEELPLMQQPAVKISEMFLPEHLLARQDEFFQFAMRAYQQVRRRRFESHPTFNPQNGVA